MSKVLGLVIGESFAEAVGLDTASPRPAQLFRQRWYLPKKSLTEGLREALRNFPKGGGSGDEIVGGTILVASNSWRRILDKNLGRSPAVIVSRGFESWLKLHQPISSAIFARRTERRSLPIDDDFVFAASGRISASGEIVVAQPIEELEFLAAKLELLKVKDVAVTLMHADLNPTHEKSIAEFLKAKGFRVVCSHELALQAGSDQKTDRFRETIENAFLTSTLLDEKEQIENAAKSYLGTDEPSGDWQLGLWSASGPLPWSQYSAAALRGGVKKALRTFWRGPLQDRKAAAGLHCGLDQFLLFTKDLSQDSDADTHTIFDLRPTALIRHGLWPFPSIAEDAAGWTPGPMAFGKSQQLAVFDVLHVLGRLGEIDAVSSLIHEKSRQRILESLMSLGKSQSALDLKARPPDPLQIAANLERAFVERCALALVALPIDFKDSPVVLSGPLAPAILPLLARRRADLRFELLRAGSGRAELPIDESLEAFAAASANLAESGV